MLTALTGTLFVLFHDWAGVPRARLKILLQIHQMSLLMNPAIYTGALALAVFVTALSAVGMLRPHLQRVAPSLASALGSPPPGAPPTPSGAAAAYSPLRQHDDGAGASL